MVCKTYELKVDKSHLSEGTQGALHRLFLEAKWFYNHLIAQGGVWHADYKATKVLVRNKDKFFESRELEYLSSQMRQEIIDRTKDNIRGLSVLKKSGRKVGALGFKSRVASIPLKQNGVTYRLDGDRVGIQKIKQPLKVRGVEQIPKGADLTSATLERRNGDYFIHVTTYQKMVGTQFPKKGLGVDAGIMNQLTLSNGLVIRESVLVTRRIRLLHRELDKRKKVHGKNWFKTSLKLNKEYRRVTNGRADIRHKIVGRLTSTCDSIAIQNDNIKGWQRMWGRQVTTSVIGGIMSDLRIKAHTPVEVERFVATSRRCSNCGAEREIALRERNYKCHSCGLLIDRDLNSARIMWKAVPAERREFTPVDTKAATEMMEYFNSIPGVSASLVVETGSHRISNRW